MRLNYEILWFENDKTSFNVKKKFVRSFLEEEGFNFIEPRNEVDGSNIETIPFNNYDLIIADLKLDNDDKGTDLLKSIREDKQIFTEVLFYSSDGEEKVRELLRDHGIDGAYCADRKNEDFEYKVKEVIKTTIKKVQDVNNMRGLVMAEVAELDIKMIFLLKKYVEGLKDEHKGTFINTRKGKLIKSLEDMIEEFQSLTDSAIFDHRDFSTQHKWRSMMSIVKTIDDDEIKAILIDYEKDIIQKRNKLAHVKEVEAANGEKILVDGDFIFNDETCRKIRKDLQKHAENLDNIKEKYLSLK